MHASDHSVRRRKTQQGYHTYATCTGAKLGQTRAFIPEVSVQVCVTCIATADSPRGVCVPIWLFRWGLSCRPRAALASEANGVGGGVPGALAALGGRGRGGRPHTGASGEALGAGEVGVGSGSLIDRATCAGKSRQGKHASVLIVTLEGCGQAEHEHLGSVAAQRNTEGVQGGRAEQSGTCLLRELGYDRGVHVR
jgi:hypothetical protein